MLAWEGAADGAGRTSILAVFAVNFVLHLVWSPLFFKFKRPDWAMIEMPFLWISIVAMMVVLSRYSSLAAWLLVPYLVWVSFAMWINYAICRLNPSFR